MAPRRRVDQQAFVVCLVFCLFGKGIVQVGGQRGADADPKIRGGTEVPRGRFSYMASLQDNNGNHKCGAVLIAGEWLLTAAHCVDPTNPKSLGTNPIAVLGDHDINDDSDNDEGLEISRISKTFIHPDYVSGDIENGSDVALLQLVRPSKKTPIVVADPNNDLANTVPLALGWGNEGTSRREGPLKMGDLTVLQFTLCKNNFWDRLKPTMICGFSRLVDTCKGDSGGPLLFPHEPDFDLKEGNPALDLLVGIVSFGPLDCTSSEKPGVYSHVPSFTEWMDQVMSGKPVTSSSPPEAPTSTSTSSSRPPPPVLTSSPLPAPKPTPRPTPIPTPITKPSSISAFLPPPVFAGLGNAPTPLHVAARDGDFEATKDLIRGGANIEAKNDIGETPLHLASFNAQEQIVKELLKSDAKVDARDDFGRTPLMAASSVGAFENTKELIRNGADLDAQSDIGESPLHIAARNNHQKIVKELIKRGADPDVTTPIGWTPLHAASFAGHTEVVKELEINGANLNAKTEKNMTPLHYASLMGNKETVKLLVDKGADASIENVDGDRPIDMIGIGSSGELNASDRELIEKFLTKKK